MRNWQSIVRWAVTLGLALSLTACGRDIPSEPSIRPALVVQPQPMQPGIQIFSGDVRAREEPALSFRVGGKIARRLVDTGARVSKGQLLAELDPDDLRLQVDAGKAQLAAAESELALAQAERDRYAEMLARQLVSESVFDAKKATFEATQAKTKSARAQFAVMENQRDYARLLAPQDGVIAQRLAEAGQVIAPGQAVFVLAVDGEREVAINVPEARIEQFRMGQSVLVELWSRAGERWPGTVRELSPSADPQARTFAARVNFASAQPVELGQSARVYVVDTEAQMLGVPLSAVGGEAGAAFVWVVDPITSRAVRRSVQILTWGEREAVIAEGLTADDWVISGGVHLVNENERVQAVDRDNRPVNLKAVP